MIDLFICMVGVASIVDALICVVANGDRSCELLMRKSVWMGVGGDSRRECCTLFVERGGVQEAELMEFLSFSEQTLPLREGVDEPPSSWLKSIEQDDLPIELSVVFTICSF